MDKEKAMEILYRSLVAYIEDCAGQGSEEAQEIDEAWDVIKKELGDK